MQVELTQKEVGQAVMCLAIVQKSCTEMFTDEYVEELRQLNEKLCTLYGMSIVAEGYQGVPGLEDKECSG